MAKADYQPRWLVSLMCQWARRELAGQDGGLGYPKKSAFLLIHSNTPARVDPTGESAQDFRELDEALKTCLKEREELWVALMMYYRPWGIQALMQRGYPFGNSTYYSRLHLAHKWVSEQITQKKVKTLAIG